MDLSSIKPTTQKVAIHHPGTGALTGLVIEVGSSETDAVKRVQRRHLDKAIRNRNKKPTAAEIESNAIERLSATIVGWTWGKDAAGKDAAWGKEQLEFTKENVATVLEAGWLRAQIEEVTGDEASFFSGGQ